VVSLGLRLALILISPADTLTVDACSLVPMEQLRFVVTAGLERAFPIRENREGTAVSLAEPKLVTATCPNLKVDLAVALKAEPPAGGPPASSTGTVHLALTLVTKAAFSGVPGKPPHTAAALAEAMLCIRRVDGVEIKVSTGSRWLTAEWLGRRLGSDLVGRVCVDVTSLVYVYLQRGGTVSGVSPAQ
jgi:hypothetical protein